MAKGELEAPWDVEAERPDVAVLVALKEEFRSLAKEYAREWFTRPSSKYVGDDVFFEGPGGYRCVATIMLEMGTTHAAAAAMRLLQWRPAVIVNVGIAGGLKKGDLCIGDVIVPREVYAYTETGKQKDAPASGAKRKAGTKPKAGTTPNGPRWERRGSSYHPTPSIVAKVQQLELTKDEAHAAWVEAGAAQLRRLRSRARPQVKALLDAELLRTKPIISTSHLASGNFVVASKAFAEFIREANANVHAGEMEAGGMMLAAEYQQEDVETLVVRGISDHVDADKSEVDAVGGGGLRRLAMDNAWRLVCTLMELDLLSRAESQKGRGRKAGAKKKTASGAPRKTKAAKVGRKASAAKLEVAASVTREESRETEAPPEAPPPPLDPADVGKVVEHLRRHPKAVNQMSALDEDWRSKAQEGGNALAEALLRPRNPIALVDRFCSAIKQLPRRTSANEVKEVADDMLDLLDLVLPVVAAPFLGLNPDGTAKASFPLTVETFSSGLDGRSIEMRERNAPNPVPRAFVDIDPKRRPKSGAHASGAALDVTMRVQAQHEELFEDPVDGVAMDVIRAADVGEDDITGLRPSRRLRVAKKALPKIRNRYDQKITLYIINHVSRTGTPNDPLVKRLRETFQELRVVEPNPDEAAEDFDDELRLALGRLYAAYRNLLEDLSR